MPKQTHGGDDDTEYVPPEPQGKPKLTKFGLGPDMNIRDVFWRIMASYATTKQAGVEPAAIYEQRFTFIKIALSLLEMKESKYYGMTPQFIVRYLLMLFLDNGWDDAAENLLQEMKEGREKTWSHLVHAIRYLLKTEKYKVAVIELLKKMIRNTNAYPTALFYLAVIKDRELAAEMKKELYIFAKGDIEENQMRAVYALALLDDDEEATKMVASLLSHWDSEVRKSAAEYLKGMKLNDEIVETIKSKIGTESSPETKKILEKLVVKWKK